MLPELIQGVLQWLTFATPAKAVDPDPDGWYRLRPGIALWTTHIIGVVIALLFGGGTLASIVMSASLGQVVLLATLSVGSACLAAWSGYDIYVRRIRWRDETLVISFWGKREVRRSFSDVVNAIGPESYPYRGYIEFRDRGFMEVSPAYLRGVPQLWAAIKRAADR